MKIKNYKAALIMIITALVSILLLSFYDFKVGYISYQAYQFGSAMLVLGLTLGIMLQQIYSQSLFSWTKKSENK